MVTVTIIALAALLALMLVTGALIERVRRRRPGSSRTREDILDGGTDSSGRPSEVDSSSCVPAGPHQTHHSADTGSHHGGFSGHSGGDFGGGHGH